MMDYKVQSLDTKNFILTGNGVEAGRLVYDSWFSFKADMSIGGTNYTIEPQGFWGTTVELKQNDTVVLDLKMNWNGNVLITVYGQEETAYILKQKSILKNTYVLTDSDHTNVLSMEADFKWKKVNYEYHVTAAEDPDKDDLNKILILASVHCLNYYMSTSMVY